MRYANPIDGGYVYPTIAVLSSNGCRSVFRPDLSQHRGSVFNVVEGSGSAISAMWTLHSSRMTLLVVPPWTPYHLETDGECVLFSYSDSRRRKRSVSGATRPVEFGGTTMTRYVWIHSCGRSWHDCSYLTGDGSALKITRA